MPPPDYSRQLNAIATALNDGSESKTASQLITEVRNALTGPGGTVRDAVLELKQTIQQKFTDLMDQIRNAPPGSGGGLRGGTPSHDDPNNSESPLRQVMQQFTEIGEKLERVLVVFEEGSHSGGSGIGGGYFGRQTYLQTYQSTQELFRLLEQGKLSVKNVTETFSNLKTQQFSANFEELSSKVMRAALHTTNLGLAFERLGHSVGQNVSGFRENIFGSNILSPGQYFFEFFNKVKDGLLVDSDSFRTTVKTVKDSLEQGLASPLAMTGKSAAELATDFNLARQAVSKQIDLRAFGTTEQTQRWMVDMTEMLQKTGTHATFNDQIAQQALIVQTDHLRKISANTGASVDALEKMVKKYTDEAAILAGIGQLTGQEVRNMGTVNTAVSGKFGPDSAKTMDDMVKKYLAGGRPENWSPAQDPGFWSRMTRDQMIAIQDMVKGNLTANDKLAIDALDRFQQASAEFQRQGREQVFVQGRQYTPEFQQLVGRLNLAGNMAGAAGQPTAAQLANAEPDKMVAGLERAFSIWENQIKILFSGLEGSFSHLLIALGANTYAIGILAGRISLMGGLGSLGGSGVIGAAGRGLSYFGGGVAGATGAALAGSSNYGIAGGGAGGIAGGWIGGMLGSSVGPLGSTIGYMAGTAIGAYLGSKLGDWLSPKPALEDQKSSPTPPAGLDSLRPADQKSSTSLDLLRRIETTQPSVEQVSPAAAAPAVPPPQNVAGPVAQAISAAVEPARSSQDQQIVLLNGLLTANVDGNNTLGQIYSELARQTGYLTGTPTTSSVPNLGRGLSVAAPAAVNAGRPDGSTPYGGPGY